MHIGIVPYELRKTKKYDLGSVGRYRINKKFALETPVEDPVLTKDDFVEVRLLLGDKK